MSRLNILVLAAGLLAGCAGQGEQVSVDSGNASDSGTAIDSSVACDPSLTYANFGATFFSAHCNSCHSISQAIAQSDAIGLSSVVLEGFMPPGGGGMTAAERDQFADWLACGAP